MKLLLSAFLLLVGAEAFAPAAQFGAARAGVSTARKFGVDPSVFHDLPHHVDTLKDAFSTMSLADVEGAIDVDAAVDTAVAASSNGWFGFLVTPIAGLLEFFHAALVGAGFSANAWGISILFMTAAIKLATFPLTKTQLESTNKMQVSNVYTNKGKSGCYLLESP
jgi:YidC/Oxa1 family membrane protein insertase